MVCFYSNQMLIWTLASSLSFELANCHFRMFYKIKSRKCSHEDPSAAARRLEGKNYSYIQTSTTTLTWPEHGSSKPANSNPDPPSESHPDPQPDSELGPVTDPVGFSSEHKDSEYMPNQQYKLSGSHPDPQIVPKAPPFTLHTGPQQTWSSLHSVDTGGLFYNRGSMVNGLHLSRQDSVSKSWADTQ